MVVGFERARNEVNPIARDELIRVVNVWADTALNLNDRDLRMMERLVRAQQRSIESHVTERSGNVVAMPSAVAIDRI